MTESVRLCYMNFALSFLVVGDCEVVSSVLGLKGMLVYVCGETPGLGG